MNLYCGIDPGKTGAIAFINEDRSLEDIFDMPIEVAAGKNRIDVDALSSLFEEFLTCGDFYPEIEICTVVERQSSRPSQGVVSVFSIGDSFGVVRALASVYSYSSLDVTPRTWQKKINRPSTGDSKADSLAYARELFPNYDGLTRKKDHNRADALLIAIYARMMFRNGGGE